MSHCYYSINNKKIKIKIMAESISSEKKRSKEYEVESIQDDRKRKDHYDHKTKKWVYITEYLIKWVGYRRRSWEPEENLNNCIQMLNSYKKNKNRNSYSYNNINGNKNNSSNRTPLKFVVNKEAAKARNDKLLNAKKEINNNNNINKSNNHSFYNPYYSDEEDDKYTPSKPYNTFLGPNNFKSENNSMTSVDSLKKPGKKKNKNNNKGSIKGSINDFDIDLDNNNENNNNNNNNNYLDILNSLKFQEAKRENKNLKINLLNRKRKLDISDDDSDDSGISISIDDPFIKTEKESMSNNNTNENSNTSINNNTNNNNKENIEILEVRIPNDKNDEMVLICRDNEKDFVFQSLGKNLVIPDKVKSDCYEKIIKNYLIGKTIKIN